MLAVNLLSWNDHLHLNVSMFNLTFLRIKKDVYFQKFVDRGDDSEKRMTVCLFGSLQLGKLGNEV